MRSQLLTPTVTFDVARLKSAVEWALLGTTSWPGVADGEFEPGDAVVLERRHPEFAGQLATFAAA